MDGFAKTITLNFNVDENSYKKANKKIENLEEEVGFSEKQNKILDEQLGLLDEINDITSDMARYNQLNTKEAKEYVKSLKSQLNEKRKLVGLDDNSQFKKSFKENLQSGLPEFNANEFGRYLGNKFALMAVLSKALDRFKDILDDAWSELESILDYSHLSNQHTRELAFNYGFSASEGYGFDKAKQLLGIQSDEDLMYMNSQQIGQFKELFSKYTEKYQTLYDSGFFEQMQEFQVDMQDFKQEMVVDVAQFFMQNKDEIKKVMQVIIDTSEFLIQSLGWIVKYFGAKKEMSDSERAANTSDIINSYSNNAKNTNIKIDNSFTNVAPTDQQSLQDMSSQMFEQIIEALS